MRLRYFGTLSIRTLWIRKIGSFCGQGRASCWNSWFSLPAGTIKIFWKPKNREKSREKAVRALIILKTHSKGNKDHFGINVDLFQCIQMFLIFNFRHQVAPEIIFFDFVIVIRRSKLVTLPIFNRKYIRIWKIAMIPKRDFGALKP